jgi:hypothetical protein
LLKLNVATLEKLFAAGDAGEFFLEALAFGGIFSFGKLIGEFEEAFMLSLFGLQAGFDQIDQYAACSCVTSFGKGANSTRDAGR